MKTSIPLDTFVRILDGYTPSQYPQRLTYGYQCSLSVLGELGLGSKTGLKQGKGKIHFTEYITRISLPAGSLSQTSHS